MSDQAREKQRELDKIREEFGEEKRLNLHLEINLKRINKKHHLEIDKIKKEINIDAEIELKEELENRVLLKQREILL